MKRGIKMVKLQILQSFRDKNNGRLYKPGEMVEFNEARAKELLGHVLDLVVVIDDFYELKNEDKPRPKKRTSRKLQQNN